MDFVASVGLGSSGSEGSAEDLSGDGVKLSSSPSELSPASGIRFPLPSGEKLRGWQMKSQMGLDAGRDGFSGVRNTSISRLGSRAAVFTGSGDSSWTNRENGDCGGKVLAARGTVSWCLRGMGDA